MFGILARLLEFLYSIWPSYGGSIILFTVIIMVVLAPLTFKSTRSMLAMQALQPEMKRLQAQYKDDRQKLNEEMMKFYQENKISPLGGCLPMLLQMPVFFILYWVLLGLTKRGPFGADLGHSVACTIDKAANTCTDIGTYANAGFFDPSYLKDTSDLYQSLTHTRVMSSFGLDLSQSAWNVISNGIVGALPYLAMVLVVMALTYLQQQQIQRRQPNKQDQNPTQQMMMKVMPVAMGFIYIIIPSAVVIYFLVSSLFRIGQQAMVTRTFYTGPNAIAIPATATEGGAVVEESGWKRFKESMPRVGHEASEQRARSFENGTGGGSGKPSAGSKGRGASSERSGGGGKARPSGNGSGSARSSGKKKSGAAKPSTGGKKKPSDRSAPGSNGKKSGQAKKSGGAKTGGSASGTGAQRPRKKGPSSKPTEASGPDTEVTRPSRSAPSRKAPEGPTDGKRKR